MKIPTSTYRIQFTSDFQFDRAREIVPYLAELGAGCLYASPIFKAKKGSTHGYDVVDQSQLNTELGTAESLGLLFKAVRDHELEWLQDFVPNHMAYDYENVMLRDVLEAGEQSPYHSFFDVDWTHAYESIRGRLLAPFLGRPYSEALEKKEIRLAFDGRQFLVAYYDLKFPVALITYSFILTHRFDELKSALGENSLDYVKLLGLLYVLESFSRDTAPDEWASRAHFVKEMLSELYSGNDQFRTFLDTNIELFNVNDADGLNLLDTLLSRQYYRLAFWKVATEEINYRRFFSINGLISLRMQEEEVFKKTHSLILRLVNEGKIGGLRLDHIDGLNNPTAYLDRLRDHAPDTWIVVEKILAYGERLPVWPVQGTTGYDFTNYVAGLFCNITNLRRFDSLYSRFTGTQMQFNTVVYGKKRGIVANHMKGDIDNLALTLKKVSGRYRYGSDITLYGLKRAIIEVLSHFPVYRTYCNSEVCSVQDIHYIREAVQGSRKAQPALHYELNFLEKFLLLSFDDHIADEERRLCVDFVMKFQQYSGPLMAKGLEDTALYVYNRLLSLNEVGGFPERFGISTGEFHALNQERVKQSPHTLNATSTHDTKRGEDVRARINALSEMPDSWSQKLKTWHKLNARHKKTVNRMKAPDKNDEYFLYQTLLGAYPFGDFDNDVFRGRIKDYVLKAVREAKVHTTWLKPDTSYQNAYSEFVEAILQPVEENEFLRDFLPFQRKIAHYGIINSLSQLTLKVASPGVPDFFQGTELWDFSLVDPDNRRPVDFAERKRMLKELKAKETETGIENLLKELLRMPEDGRLKLLVTHRLLAARKRNAELFTHGDYHLIRIDGVHKRNVVAFGRRHRDRWAIVVVPRLMVGVVDETEFPLGKQVWQDTAIVIPPDSSGIFTDCITGAKMSSTGSILAGDILSTFPVGMLLNEE